MCGPSEHQPITAELSDDETTNKTTRQFTQQTGVRTGPNRTGPDPTVGPADDVLQESVLRGHETPPSSRHPAVLLQREAELLPAAHISDAARAPRAVE